MTLMTTPRPVRSLQHEINRAFDTMFGDMQSNGNGNGHSRAWTPVVDVAETPDTFMIKAELPGVTTEDIQLNMQNNVLNLYGEKRHESNKEDHNFYRVERSYGAFQRSFNFPATVDADKIQAEFQDGVLTITLPKVEEAKPREIAIKSN